jgi:hypothetical protein
MKKGGPEGPPLIARRSVRVLLRLARQRCAFVQRFFVWLQPLLVAL